MATTSLDIIISAKDRVSGMIPGIKSQLTGLSSSVTSFKGMLVGGLGALGLGLGFHELISAAEESENAMHRFRASMGLLGKDSDAAAEQASKFANGIQSITTMDDEAVLNLMSLGSTLTGLSGGPLEEATTAAIGLSKSLGVDTESAMRLVGKAVNGNFAAFAKYGVQLDDNATNQEKLNTVIQKGVEAFKLAEAESDTTSGRMTQLKNNLGNIAEAIGGLLLPHIKEMAEAINEHLPAIEAWVSSWKTAGLNIVGTLQQLWPSMQLGALTFIQSFIDNALSFGGWFVSWVPSIIGVFENAILHIEEFFVGLWDSIYFGAQRAFAKIVDAIEGLRGAAVDVVAEARIRAITPEDQQAEAIDLYRRNRAKDREMAAGGLNDTLAGIDKREAEQKGLRENVFESGRKDMRERTAASVKDLQEGIANLDAFGFRAGLKEAIKNAQDELDKSSGAGPTQEGFKAPKATGQIAVKGQDKAEDQKQAKALREINPLANLETSRFLTGVTQAGRERGDPQIQILEQVTEQTKLAKETAETQKRIADRLEGGEGVVVGLEGV